MAMIFCFCCFIGVSANNNIRGQGKQNVLDAVSIEKATGKCEPTDKGTGKPICGHSEKYKFSFPNTEGDQKTLIDCGEIISLPDTDYQFLESAASLPHLDYAYVPANRCKDKKGKDDPSCAADKTMDIYKFYPVKPEAPAKQFEIIATVKNFAAFGTALADEGDILFACDIANTIIGVNTKTKKTIFKMQNVRHPNDIAIWQHGKKLTLYICGNNHKFALAGAGHNWGVSEFVLRDASGAWASTERKSLSRSGWVKSNVECFKSEGFTDEESGCDWDDFDKKQRQIRRTNPSTYVKWMGTDRFLSGICAGIGLDFVKRGPNKKPDIWAALLDKMVYVDNANEKPKVHNFLRAKEMYGEFHCTLPQHSNNHQTGWTRKYGLLDNIAMLRGGTMVTALYMNCWDPNPGRCLQGQLIWKEMYTKTTGYRTFALSKQCLNEFHTLLDGQTDVREAYEQSEKVHMLEMNMEHKRGHQNGQEVDIKSYAGKNGFNARITHFERVGDDLIGINYQFPKILVLKGAAKNLESKCGGEGNDKPSDT